ncbi:hypothetical protein O6H91_05G005500 [Diphasiastrum complanatum]|uniref:Uncharacterized protein n=2 Tax=Diphasiastrum complanatum TaxID=34168 RepID=A0ACC2DKG1_DIPCM|nr:hypothetical protein O6H91_05G005000 [Diphasiastrum complanatum]KAJ7554704.1 hypothetical protein O6H91_05G005500 [Diphasiastrum complanatum]
MAMAAAAVGMACPSASSNWRRTLHSPKKGLILQSSFVSHSLRSAFFDDGGDFASISLPFNHENGRSGGALGVQMNIFERVVRIVRSYANAIVSSAEDPEKLLDQTVLEMNEDLVKMRQASAQVLASQKQLENKYKQAQQIADDWYKRARLALEKGEESLAREALKRRKTYEESAKALKSQLEQQTSVVEKLISNTRLLESKIQEARSKKDTLKARAQSAKTAQKVNEMLGNINTSSALAAFEKMEEKVTALEAEADALNQLSTDDLAGKFTLLESESVDDDLAALKRDMLGPSKRTGELPEGRTPVSNLRSSSSNVPFQEFEIEKELNELRRKTNEF